jgi:hypothetical protein
MDESYAGPERRANDRTLASLRLEMAQVRASVEAATNDLVTQESLNRTAKRAARRLSATYTLTGLTIAVIGGFLWVNQQSIKRVAIDARKAAVAAQEAANTLNDCLITGGQCYNRLAAQGTQGSVRQMKFQACVLAQVPEDRSTDKIIGCAKRSYPDIENLDDQLREALR